MDKFYITHLKRNQCRSYIIPSTKEALQEWYLENVEINMPSWLWDDITKYGATTGCTRRDDDNNVTVAFTR